MLQTHGSVVNLQDVDGVFVVKAILVHTHDGLHSRVDACLCAGCSLLDAHLGQAGLDGLCHTAQLLDLLYVLPSLVVQLLCELLYIVGTSPWVDVLAHLCLVLDIDLRVAGNTGREVGGKCNGLVQSVGMQALCVAKHSCHSLDTGTAHIVEGILLGE